MEREASDFFKPSLAAQYSSFTFLPPGTNVAGSSLPCTWFPGNLDDDLVTFFMLVRMVYERHGPGSSLSPGSVQNLAAFFFWLYLSLNRVDSTTTFVLALWVGRTVCFIRKLLSPLKKWICQQTICQVAKGTALIKSRWSLLMLLYVKENDTAPQITSI